MKVVTSEEDDSDLIEFIRLLFCLYTLLDSKKHLFEEVVDCEPIERINPLSS